MIMSTFSLSESLSKCPEAGHCVASLNGDGETLTKKFGFASVLRHLDNTTSQFRYELSRLLSPRPQSFESQWDEQMCGGDGRRLMPAIARCNDLHTTSLRSP